MECCHGEVNVCVAGEKVCSVLHVLKWGGITILSYNAVHLLCN